MPEKEFYEMHRSDAIQILLSRERYPMPHSNLKLAELLEKYFPEKERMYVVKEDHLPLSGNIINLSNF